jgi:histidinol-phosphate aminotransferase
VDPAQIALSTGSVAVSGDLVRAVVGEGDEVVHAWRSFEAYPILVGSHGGISVRVPLTEAGEHDLEAMAAAITERTRLVLLCTPNNPTGASLSTEQVEDLLARVPEDVVVAIDEAYREFHDPATVLGTAGIFRRHGNVVLLRTFSKLQGLAGLRIGYAVAHPRLARALSQVTVPFGAAAPAQAAALASLEPAVQEELDRRAERIRAERSRVMAALSSQGWSLPASQGNFVYFPLGERSAEFAEFADARGLVLRAYGTDGVRVTIAEEEANDRLIRIAEAWRER